MQAVSQMIHPGVRDVLGFMWSHLEKDMEVLGRTLDQNMDNTAVIINLVLQACLEFTAGDYTFLPFCFNKSFLQIVLQILYKKYI